MTSRANSTSAGTDSTSGAVVEGVAIFESRRHVGTLPDGADAGEPIDVLQCAVVIDREVAADAREASEPVEARHCVVVTDREVGADAIVKGLRGGADFDAEHPMALMNRHLHAGCETVFILPAIDTMHVSSRLVREIAAFGGRVDDLVPRAVAARRDIELSRAEEELLQFVADSAVDGLN